MAEVNRANHFHDQGGKNLADLPDPGPSEDDGTEMNWSHDFRRREGQPDVVIETIAPVVPNPLEYTIANFGLSEDEIAAANAFNGANAKRRRLSEDLVTATQHFNDDVLQKAQEHGRILDYLIYNS